MLNEIESGQGKNKKGEAAPHSKRKAAKDAGLSERQQKTAQRVAKIPEAEFEAAVESENPPTITALAEAGKEKPRRSGANYGGSESGGSGRTDLERLQRMVVHNGP